MKIKSGAKLAQQQEPQDEVDELELETDSFSGSPTYIAAVSRGTAAGGGGSAANKRQTKEMLAEQLRAASRRQAAVPKPKDAFTAALEHHEGRTYPGAGWRFLVNFLIIFPWTLVLAMTWLLNTWQLLFRPIGGALWYAVDWLDQRMPTLVEWILWGVYQVSLMLHVVTVGIDLGVIWIMWVNGRTSMPFVIVAAYSFAHYASAITMFKELDLRDVGGTYFSDVMALFWRQLDVLFYDVQLCASVVHGNRVLDGMTQLMFKGYEEHRVALVTLLFTMPCCILMGVEYAVFMGGRLDMDVKHLELLSSYQDQLYAALCFSVINSIEKVLRMSLVDPWMHEKRDGFPILYVRSHAARLPGSVVKDWCFRCRVMLAEQQGRLVLKDLYSHYVQQVKEVAYGLSDSHRAYLLRKAMHVFNTRRLHRPESDKLSDRPLIQALIADGLAPGQQLSKMLADIILDSSALHTLSLADNGLDDAAVVAVMEAVKANDLVALQDVNLAGNAIGAAGAAAVSEVLANNQSIHSLNLARNSLQDEGAMALAEALRHNIHLFRLDLSSCGIGPEGALALAGALKVNAVLAHLNLSNTAIGTGGGDVIAKALRNSTSSSLRELDLGSTSCDDKAAGSLAALLATPGCKLERLLLSNTNITDAGAQLLCNALQNNTTLQVIDVSNNMCMDKSWQKLLNHVVKGKPKA